MGDVLLRELGTPLVVIVYFFEPILKRARITLDRIAIH